MVICLFNTMFPSCLNNNYKTIIIVFIFQFWDTHSANKCSNNHYWNIFNLYLKLVLTAFSSSNQYNEKYVYSFAIHVLYSYFVHVCMKYAVDPIYYIKTQAMWHLKSAFLGKFLHVKIYTVTSTLIIAFRDNKTCQPLQSIVYYHLHGETSTSWHFLIEQISFSRWLNLDDNHI